MIGDPELQQNDIENDIGTFEGKSLKSNNIYIPNIYLTREYVNSVILYSYHVHMISFSSVTSFRPSV